VKIVCTLCGDAATAAAARWPRPACAKCIQNLHRVQESLEYDHIAGDEPGPATMESVINLIHEAHIFHVVACQRESCGHVWRLSRLVNPKVCPRCKKPWQQHVPRKGSKKKGGVG